MTSGVESSFAIGLSSSAPTTSLSQTQDSFSRLRSYASSKPSGVEPAYARPEKTFSTGAQRAQPPLFLSGCSSVKSGSLADALLVRAMQLLPSSAQDGC